MELRCSQKRKAIECDALEHALPNLQYKEIVKNGKVLLGQKLSQSVHEDLGEKLEKFWARAANLETEKTRTVFRREKLVERVNKLLTRKL